jgi:hypothetical protein
MPRIITVILQYGDPPKVVGVAETMDGAREWLQARIDRHNQLRDVCMVANHKVAAWMKENPNPFTEPPPDFGAVSWPAHLNVRDPYALAEAKRIRAKANELLDAWCDRKEAADRAYMARHDEVFKAAAACVNPTEEELGDMLAGMYKNILHKQNFEFQEWGIVD